MSHAKDSGLVRREMFDQMRERAETAEARVKELEDRDACVPRDLAEAGYHIEELRAEIARLKAHHPVLTVKQCTEVVRQALAKRDVDDGFGPDLETWVRDLVTTEGPTHAIDCDLDEDCTCSAASDRSDSPG